MRERQYPDSELAYRLRVLVKKALSLSDREVGQEGNRVYVRYGRRGFEEEYVCVFNSEGEGRRFFLHMEHPVNNLLGTLEKELMSDNAVKKKGNLKKYEEIFERISVGEGSVTYEGGEVPTAVSLTKIKEIPLGKEGRLSGNFLKYLFDYGIKPFMLVVDKHQN